MKNASGQALVTLLFFTVIAIIVTSAAVTVMVLNLQGASSLEQGTDAYALAESGAENVLIRLLRDPAYTGETMYLADGQVTATVSGSAVKIATVSAVSGTSQRKIEVRAVYNNYIYTVQSWKEVN